MNKKSKKAPQPSVEEVFGQWCPEEKESKWLSLIPYNYRCGSAGFKKIRGIGAVGEKRILIYENGEKKAVLSVADYDGALFLKDNGCCRIVLKKREERTVLALGDLSYADRFASEAQALDRFFESGRYAPPKPVKEKTCPKCGRRYRPGSNSCVRCGNRKGQISWLSGIIKPLVPLLILSFCLFAGISLVGLISPKLSQKMVDGYLNTEKAGKDDLVPYLLVVLGLFGCTLAGKFLSALRGLLTARIGSRAIKDLRNSVFSKVQKLTLAGVNERTVGELLQRISEDTAVISNFLTSTLGDVVEKLVTFAAIGGILIYQDVTHGTYLFVMIFLPVIPALILFRIFNRKIHRMYRNQWQVESKSNTVLHDIFSGIRVVKAYGREQAEIAHYDGAIHGVRHVQKRNELFWAVFSPILNFILCMGEFFVLFVVGNKILKQEMTLGEMTMLTAYASMIYTPLRSMAAIPRRIMRALNSLAKIYDLMEDPSVLTEKENAIDAQITGQITFENVSFGYETGQTVLKDLNLEIHPGEMIGLVGRSGVGKSTLINLVMRLYTPTEGRVLLDGQDITDLSSRCLKNNVGAVLQETFLFAGTIRNNIAYAKPDATGAEIIAAAKIAGAHDFVSKLPDGYDTYVGERGYTLSGGERQRIAIARAVLLDPKILILDEATSALDTETEKNIQEALARLIEGRTTIAIAHRLSTLRNATRIIVLDQKGIAEEGSHEQLMCNEKGIYYGLVMAQRKMSEKKKRTDLP